MRASRADQVNTVNRGGVSPASIVLAGALTFVGSLLLVAGILALAMPEMLAGLPLAGAVAPLLSSTAAAVSTLVAGLVLDGVGTLLLLRLVKARAALRSP